MQLLTHKLWKLHNYEPVFVLSSMQNHAEKDNLSNVSFWESQYDAHAIFTSAYCRWSFVLFLKRNQKMSNLAERYCQNNLGVDFHTRQLHNTPTMRIVCEPLLSFFMHSVEVFYHVCISCGYNDYYIFKIIKPLAKRQMSFDLSSGKWHLLTVFLKS